MALKHYTLNIQELSIDPKLGLKDYSLLFKTGVRLKEYLLNKDITRDIKSGRTPSRFNEDYWHGENEFLTMSDVDTLTFSLNKECEDKITDYAIEEEKTLYQAKENSLIISNAMTLGLSFLTDRPIYINQNVFEVNLDETRVNKKFVLWYFNLVIRPLFQTTYTVKYLSKDELGRINIPAISTKQQDKIASKIEPIEKRIVELKNTIKEYQEVVNKVFARDFKFDERLCDEFGKGMSAGTQNAKEKKLRTFETDFAKITRSKILRFSTRYYNPPTIKLMYFLDSLDTLTVKDILKEEIHRGVSPKYDEDGNIPVVKTAHLKNRYIEISKEEFVNATFYNSSLRSQVKEHDILIASTGKASLGKIDIVDTDEKLVADGHISIIRINEKQYNPLFLVYYFRSLLGFFQIERDFTGATNQIELYSDEISNFKILDIPLKTQQKIVNEIKAELDKQVIIKKKIEEERNKIELIIEKAVK